MSTVTDSTQPPSVADARPPERGSPTSVETLDRYVLLSLIGAGAMGVVHAAYDPELDRKVAIKLLKNGRVGHGRQQRLRREAQALAQLDHPNVVTVHDVGDFEGQLFIVMELVDGQTLREWLRADPRRPWPEIVTSFIAAGRGLCAAHDAGLVHRDFKPDNVMIGDDGRVRVMDFGLVRAAAYVDSSHRDADQDDDEPSPRQLSRTLTGAGAMVGTLAYMAPEQCRSQPSDASTDQFGFCVALYEALYGRRPFPSHDVDERLDAIASGRLASPTRGDEVPARLRRAICAGLAWDSAQRWPSMDALLTALANALGRRQRGRGPIALTGAVAIGCAVAMSLIIHEDDPRCMGMEAHLAGVWDAPRREAARSAIEGTALSYAEDTWVRVERTIDDYSRRWVEARVDACEATQRGEQSESLLDRRMACLDDHLAQIRVTVDVLSEADEEIVRVATKALRELPALELCTNTEALATESFPLPEDPATASRVEAISSQLTTAEVLGRTSQHEQGLELLAAVREEVSTIGYLPLKLRATLLE
ncbi:MAG: serine/threonine-protein kinase, partial [Nannocystaceae bacterium]